MRLTLGCLLSSRTIPPSPPPITRTYKVMFRLQQHFNISSGDMMNKFQIRLKTLKLWHQCWLLISQCKFKEGLKVEQNPGQHFNWQLTSIRIFNAKHTIVHWGTRAPVWKWNTIIENDTRCNCIYFNKFSNRRVRRLWWKTDISFE